MTTNPNSNTFIICIFQPGSQQSFIPPSDILNKIEAWFFKEKTSSQIVKVKKFSLIDEYLKSENGIFYHY